MEVSLGQCLVYARLVGAEGAPTLQQQRDAIERRPRIQPMRLLQPLGG
jgi:hypothetical protein